MNARECLHRWAQQNEGKGKSGNVFFEGKSCYSYGHHFEMARFVGDMVLMNERGYSPTTRKHKSWCHSAVSHKTVIEVPSFEAHKDNLTWLIKNLEDELYTLSRARKHLDTRLDWYAGNVDKALEYADAFKKEVGAALYQRTLTLWKNRTDPFTPAVKKQFEARATTDRVKAKEERIEREKRTAAARLEEHEALKRWVAGEDVYRNFFNVPVALRVKDNEIQTSRGASVPVIEARKFWHTLKAGQNVIGMRLGHYTVSAIDGSTLVVGCHNIPLREVARMSVALGLESEAV